MNCKISIIIASFQRPHLLKWNLYSLARQNIPFSFETIVLNDGIPDDTEAICQEYKQKLNLKYFFTGQRNIGNKIIWRVPGFSFNIGAQLSCGEILIICGAEIYHMNDSIEQITRPLLLNLKSLGIPIVKNDKDASFLNQLINIDNSFNPEHFFNKASKLDARIPYLMSVSREEFFNIGGYDEDFIGIAAEDNDLVDRLIKHGCSYEHTKAQVIHLYHPPISWNSEQRKRLEYNRKLYAQRSKQIIRNQNREWGKLK